MIPLIARVLLPKKAKKAAKPTGKAEARVQEKIAPNQVISQEPTSEKKEDSQEDFTPQIRLINTKIDRQKDLTSIIEQNEEEIHKEIDKTDYSHDDETEKKLDNIHKDVTGLKKFISSQLIPLKIITKENVEVNTKSLEEQKNSQEWNERQAYEAKHRRIDKVKSMGSAVVQKAKDTGSGIANMATKANDATGGGGLMGMLGKVFAGGALIKMFWPQIKEGISKLGDMIMEHGPQLFEDITNGLINFVGKAMDWLVENGPSIIASIFSKLTSLVTMLLDKIVEHGPEMIQKLISGLGELAKFALNTIIKYGPTLVEMTLKGLLGLGKMVLGLVVDFGPKLLGMVWDGYKKLGAFVLDTVSDLGSFIWDSITAGAKNIGSWISDKIQDLFQSALDGIESFVRSTVGNTIADFMFGKKQTEEQKENNKTVAKLNETTGSSWATDSDELKDQLAADGVIDKTLYGKEEIKDKKKLHALPVPILKQIILNEYFSEEDNKIVQNIIDSKEKKQEVAIQKQKETEYMSTDQGKLDNVNKQIEEEYKRAEKFKELKDKVPAKNYSMMMAGHEKRLKVLNDKKQKLTSSIQQGPAANIINENNQNDYSHEVFIKKQDGNILNQDSTNNILNQDSSANILNQDSTNNIMKESMDNSSKQMLSELGLSPDILSGLNVDSTDFELKDMGISSEINTGEVLKASSVQATQKRSKPVEINENTKRLAKHSSVTPPPAPAQTTVINQEAPRQTPPPTEITLNSSEYNEGGFILLGNTI